MQPDTFNSPLNVVQCSNSSAMHETKNSLCDKLAYLKSDIYCFVYGALP